ACQNLNEAVNTIDWLLGLTDPTNIYFCTSLQSQCEEKIARSGRKYSAAKRLLENAVVLRSFYLDIDYGGDGHKEPENGYVSIQEAVHSLAAFIRQTGLPKPTFMVKTGGGLHVYWTVVDPIPTDEWRLYAYALAEAGKAAGLKADYTAT